MMNYCVKHAIQKSEVNNVTNYQPCSDRVTLRCKFDTDLPEDSWYLKSYYLACGRLQDIPAGVLAPTDDVTQSGCDKRSGSIYGAVTQDCACLRIAIMLCDRSTLRRTGLVLLSIKMCEFLIALTPAMRSASSYKKCSYGIYETI